MYVGSYLVMSAGGFEKSAALTAGSPQESSRSAVVRGEDGTDHPKSDASLLDVLPAAFLDFLRTNAVPLEAFRGAEGALPRYVRLNPSGRLASTNLEGYDLARVIEAELGSKVERVAWLGQDDSHRYAKVFACDASVNLSRTAAYRDGSLYGIDAASVFAVRCLDPQPGDAVLDLCCAPGAKLCALSDAVLPNGEVVGVDLAEHRLAACRSLLKKYDLHNVRLALGDGTSWDMTNAKWLDLDPPRGRGQRGRKRRFEGSMKADASAAELAEEVAASTQPRTFDRVLVDAECTHDGSLKHVEKFRTQWGLETMATRVPWLQTGDLYQLQLKLLRNGFRLLREGGVLVYSTCSLCRRQNEDIVSEFLKHEPEAVLSPLPLPQQPPVPGAGPPSPSTMAAPARPSLLEAETPGAGGRYCTARFDPTLSGTSGLFVALLTRRVAQSPISRTDTPSADVALREPRDQG